MAAPTTIQAMNLLQNNIAVVTDPVTSLGTSLAVGGFLYYAKLVLGAGATSNAIPIPQGQLLGCWVQALTGAPTVYITLSSQADILAGNAVWTTLSLSGITQIPSAVTAIYVVGDGSGETVLINARMIGG